MIVYRPGEPPERTEYTAPIPLEDLQAAVGGYIEAVPYWDHFVIDDERVRAVVWCNEEGKLQDPPLPRNDYMTKLWEAFLLSKGMSRFGKRGEELDYLVGPIAVVTGDDEFMDEL
jgi:hypothetical protein